MIPEARSQGCLVGIGTMDGQRKLKPLLELPPCPERLLKYERVWENDLSLSQHLPVWRFLLAEPN